mmetsp:Transcript_17534/g.70436  ORF Transcript_17534/g.70436 Transcript_17534/m.70436 type:complete len:130 (-) Transcript_17534:846-1235(-)
MVVVFLVSAAVHELLVSVPCHFVRLWAFLGMMAQIPLIALTNWIYDKLPSKSRVGNYLFWVSFCIIGQPACLMLYFHDWLKEHEAIKTTADLIIAGGGGDVWGAPAPHHGGIGAHSLLNATSVAGGGEL